MVRPVLLRRVGAVVALLGISCLLVAPVLPWVHFEPDRTVPSMAGLEPKDYATLQDYSLLRILVIDRPLFHPAPAILILYLLPLLGSCFVAIEGLRAWQGSAATHAGVALLLLGMSCALFGLSAIPELVHVSTGIFRDGFVMLHTAGLGARLASLGFVAIVAGGVLLAVGAFLHRWTL
ncbi:MAG: hypothetical protein ACXVDA_19830, partial [Ktedonobacterales bacterium]